MTTPKPRVLMVDDDGMVRRAVARMLRSRYDVVEASGIADLARVLAADTRPLAAAVVDYEMKDGDGFDAQRLIVAHRPGQGPSYAWCMTWRAALAIAPMVLYACASGGDETGTADATTDVAVETASEVAAEATADGCIEGASCSPAPCHRGRFSCASGCRDEGPLPAGTRCGVFEGSNVCNATGDCVPCVTGDACTVDPCTMGTLDCSTGAPKCVASGPAPKNTTCGTNKICDGSGKCVGDLVTVTVSCASGTKTGNALCADKGFASASAVNGYFWFQCAGPLDCPGGFKGETCPDFCGGKDCVGVAFCGGGYTIGVRSGDGTTSFRADDSGYNCSGYNPGWMVRLRCRY